LDLSFSAADKVVGLHDELLLLAGLIEIVILVVEGKKTVKVSYWLVI
jgi:hypothetical protein